MWYYHYWWAWPSILKVLRVTSLQYFYNISKTELRMKFIFCMQINIKVSTSSISGHTCPKYPKYEVGNIFLISVATVFYCDAKYEVILRGSSHVCCYLFSMKTLQTLMKWNLKLSLIHNLLANENVEIYRIPSLSLEYLWQE